MLIGRAGSDPEMRYTQDGTPVANFNLATSKQWKDKSDTKQEKTTWHKIIAWRRLAEIVEKLVTKGSQLYVEGELDIREYEGRDGVKRKSHEIVAIQILKLAGGKNENGAGPSSGSGRSSSGSQSHDHDDDCVPEDDFPV